MKQKLLYNMLIFYEAMVDASCILALLKRIAIAQNSNNFINFQVEKLPSRNKTLPLHHKLDGAHNTEQAAILIQKKNSHDLKIRTASSNRRETIFLRQILTV